MAQDAGRQAETLELARDRLRLNGVLPKLRERYTEALCIERRDRWLAERQRVAARSDELREEYASVDAAHRTAKAGRDKVIARMEACDDDIVHVNRTAQGLDI